MRRVRAIEFMKFGISSFRHLRNRRWGGCVYVLQNFFSVFFCLFFVFPVRQKIPDNRSRERLNGFLRATAYML